MLKNPSLIVTYLYLSVLVLLPFSRLAELPILILSIIGIIAVFKQKLNFQSPRVKVLNIVFFSYLIMILISSLDSYWTEKSLLVGFASFRFYFATLALLAFINKDHYKLLVQLVSLYTIFLALDALFQYFIGFNLIGRQSYPDRLNGMFGLHHAKLGPFLALLFPLVLITLKNHSKAFKWFAILAIVSSVLLSGTRSAWIMIIFTGLAYFFFFVKENKLRILSSFSLLILILLTTLWMISPEFQQRIQRSTTLFQGSEKAIDHALANRLPIWQSSVNMIQAHPINGVGAHAFRKAYPEFAEEDDFWLQQGGVGMHAHHWLLEVLSETGLIGLSLFIFAIIKLIRFIKPQIHSKYTWAFSIALFSAFLPITSIYSIFASFWSICLWIVGSALILVSHNNE